MSKLWPNANCPSFLRIQNPTEHIKFLPYELDDVNDSPAAMQVTSFNCGGIVIGLELSHKVADGASFFSFINNRAATARGASNIVTPQLDVATHFPPRTLPGFDPNIGMSKN